MVEIDSATLHCSNLWCLVGSLESNVLSISKRLRGIRTTALWVIKIHITTRLHDTIVLIRNGYTKDLIRCRVDSASTALLSRRPYHRSQLPLTCSMAEASCS